MNDRAGADDRLFGDDNGAVFKIEGDAGVHEGVRIDDELVIDATRGGNSARWINHSCAPNCEIEEEGQQVFIDAGRDIKPGEELTYDYNLQIGEKHTKKAKREHACFCRARRCRS